MIVFSNSSNTQVISCKLACQVFLCCHSIQINRDRYLERWVNVNMANACCLAADENCIFVGGTQGVVRMFRALDLQIITTLPRPHVLGLDISQVGERIVFVN